MASPKRLILPTVALVVIGSAALAAESGASPNDAGRVAQAAIPLVQAVQLAEKSLGGKASRAEFNDSRLGPVYDIEIVSGAKVFDVRVDAIKGVVISSAGDKADHDDDEEAKD